MSEKPRFTIKRSALDDLKDGLRTRSDERALQDLRGVLDTITRLAAGRPGHLVRRNDIDAAHGNLGTVQMNLLLFALKKSGHITQSPDGIYLNSAQP